MGWFCEGPSIESAKSHHRNSPSGILGATMETAESFEARYEALSYPTNRLSRTFQLAFAKIHSGL